MIQPSLPSATSFDDVLRQELHHIAASRKVRDSDRAYGALPPNQDLAGLALSGGGVRSATFSLGVFQALARFGLLRRLDYLSSTGGGSNIAGWLTAWIHRSGCRQVEEHLGRVELGGIEAPEIQALRRSLSSPAGGNVARSSGAALTWIRNVSLNLVVLGAVFAALLLATDAGLREADNALRNLETGRLVGLIVGALTGTLSASLLRFVWRHPEQTLRVHLSRRHTFSAALAGSLVSAVLVGIVLSDYFSGPFQLLGPAIFASILTVFCFVAWYPVRSGWTLLQHGVSSLVAGAAGGFLPFLFLMGLLVSLPSSASYFYTQAVTEATIPLILVGWFSSVPLYGFLMGFRLVRPARETSVRFSISILSVAAFWFLVVLVWTYTNPHGLLAVSPELLVLFSVILVSAVLLLRLGMLQSSTPYVFAIGFAGAIATVLKSSVFERGVGFTELIISLVMLTVALLLLWLIRANELTMYGYHRARVARDYLAPAAISARQRTELPEDDDVELSEFTDGAAYPGPYPLFGAALDISEADQSGTLQRRTVPFLFSPLFSGFERPRTGDGKPSLVGAYRPTQRLGGGVSTAAAIAISEPLRMNHLRPPSAAAALLWSIFDMLDGRRLGNPAREDAWEKSGPFIGPGYAFFEGLRGFGDLPAYVRPFGSAEFDNLGIYELIKRHCRFIVSCDVSDDPKAGFEDFGATIRRCRTELGIEIEINLSPIAQKPNSTRAHCHMAVIRYPAEDPGLMLYIKPSLTGDEPSDLLQYANAHPEFPSCDVPGKNFGESEFESYRQLGSHIVESLLRVIGSYDSLAEMTTEEIFRAIRRQLQPELNQSETLAESPTTELLPAPPQELVDALAANECLLSTGAGLAAQAGLPTWTEFLEGLLRFARDKNILQGVSATGLASSLSAGDLEAVADELTHQVPREILVDFVQSTNSPRTPSQAHNLLARLPFLGVSNMNPDNTLATAFENRSPTFVPAEAGKLVAALQSKTFFIANVLGTASQPSSLLFTMKEFRALLSTNLQFRQFLTTLFLRYTVFFVGSGVEGIRDYLEALELPNRPERAHFAFVSHSGQIDPVKLRYLERTYNVRVIVCQPRFDHAELISFLEQVQIAVAEKAPRTERSSALVLKSVTLENIGPFERLHLDLTSSWNLLLGDNGVGKTVVLRAIAASLCGEKSDSAAVTRLLRSGSSSGSIRLEVEGREYTVQLKRDSEGEVMIDSASLSPIKYDNWLVLGFPALRGIPWERPKGPAPLRRLRPSANDLLPILRGGSDDRLTDIKQWLVNLDYAAGKEPDPSPSRKALEGFFEVLQQLTPGLSLRLHSIEKDMEITVQTDSGLVPFESISQGSGSVLCWIGTLLERLSETDDTREPRQGRALVLIDEIDAHMHPKWQQSFVSSFRDLFPGVQVIASTHSPLVVGSLKPEEIWLLHRAPLVSEIYGVVGVEKGTDGTMEIVILGPEDDEGQPGAKKREERRYRVPDTTELLVNEGEIVEENEPLTKGDTRVAAERLRAKERGWRTDQILTSPLFSLETTIDLETAKLLGEYKNLLAMDNLSDLDKEKLVEFSRELQLRLATPGETEVARKAYELIQDFATERLNNLSPQKRREVLNEVKVQLTESITGSRSSE